MALSLHPDWLLTSLKASRKHPSRKHRGIGILPVKCAPDRLKACPTSVILRGHSRGDPVRSSFVPDPNESRSMKAVGESRFDDLQYGDLEELAALAADPCVSILLPTHRKGQETQQDVIRLKNLLNQAREQLRESELDDHLLQPVESKLNDGQFWRHQGDGLAVYVTRDETRMIRLGRVVKEQVVVGAMPFIAPLIAETNSMGAFLVLSLSWSEAKLLRVDGDRMQVVHTERLPGTFDELVTPRDPEESIQHASQRAPQGRVATSTATIHGHGEGEDKIEADRRQYLTFVGQEVAKAAYNKQMHLVLVATQEVIGHFEGVTGVEIDATVEGSPDELSELELRQRARDAIAPLLKDDTSQWLERFGTEFSNDRGSHDAAEVLAAAQQGRVDSMMLSESFCQNPESNELVVATLRQGGNVYVREEIAPENVSGSADEIRVNSKIAEVSAIFRF